MEVERFLDHREVIHTKKGAKIKTGARAGTRKTSEKVTREYLVLWQGCSPAEASWEPESNLLAQAQTMLNTYRKSIGKVVPMDEYLTGGSYLRGGEM